MAKYDWENLKHEYLLGDYNSLREFAEQKNINYDVLRRRGSKWNDEKVTIQSQKSHKIIEAVTEQEIQYEIDRNAAHMAAGDLIMAKLNIAIGGIKSNDKYALNKLKTAAEALGSVQKIQRLGEGGSAESAVNIIDDL